MLKKLLALFLAWFTAFFNNVEFVEPPKTEGYQPGKYYTLETGESRPDYRVNRQVPNQLDNKSVCLQAGYIATKYDASADTLRVDGKTGLAGDYVYWWQASTDTTPCDASQASSAASTIDITEGGIIVAPTACKRTTSSGTLQSYPLSMTVEINRNSVQYIVTITGMYCWACDAFRNLDMLDGKPVIIHTYTDEGAYYQMGYVLGIAGEDCKIRLQKRTSDGVVDASMSELFNL